MTTEACTTKLAYIFGRGIVDLEMVSQLLSQSMRGEISNLDHIGRKFFNNHDVISLQNTHDRINSKI